MESLKKQINLGIMVILIFIGYVTMSSMSSKNVYKNENQQKQVYTIYYCDGGKERFLIYPSDLKSYLREEYFELEGSIIFTMNITRINTEDRVQKIRRGYELGNY